VRLTILSLLLLATGCGPAQDGFGRDRAAGVPPSAAPAGEALAAPERLVGEYRVAGIDGQPLEAPFGIAVSIDDDTLGFDPRCAGFVWTYRYRGGGLATLRSPDLPDRAAGPSGCVTGFTVLHERLAEAIDAAERAERTPENGILLSGRGRSVLLFSQ